jgi:hypothetical protein
LACFTRRTASRSARLRVSIRLPLGVQLSEGFGERGEPFGEERRYEVLGRPAT